MQFKNTCKHNCALQACIAKLDYDCGKRGGRPAARKTCERHPESTLSGRPPAVGPLSAARAPSSASATGWRRRRCADTQPAVRRSQSRRRAENLRCWSGRARLVTLAARNRLAGSEPVKKTTSLRSSRRAAGARRRAQRHGCIENIQVRRSARSLEARHHGRRVAHPLRVDAECFGKLSLLPGAEAGGGKSKGGGTQTAMRKRWPPERRSGDKRAPARRYEQQ